jgi:hypothetical protein
MDWAMRIVCATSAAVLVSGCTRAADAPAAGSDRQPAARLANRAAPEATAEVPMVQMDPNLPAWTFAKVPGWLAFTVQPAARRKNGWTPAHPNATAVILQAEPWSETVEEGSRFRLVVAEGNLPLVLSEVSQIPYGCDDIPTTMAAFRTPHDLGEQLAWILPESFEEARASTIQAQAASAKQRTYSVDGLVVRLGVSGADKGELRIERDGEVVYTQRFDKPHMEGADNTPLALDGEFEIGVPYPQAGFRLDGATAFLVLRTLSYEGVHFEVVRIGARTVESAGASSVYLCAF